MGFQLPVPTMLAGLPGNWLIALVALRMDWPATVKSRSLWCGAAPAGHAVATGETAELAATGDR